MHTWLIPMTSVSCVWRQRRTHAPSRHISPHMLSHRGMVWMAPARTTRSEYQVGRSKWSSCKGDEKKYIGRRCRRRLKDRLWLGLKLLVTRRRRRAHRRLRWPTMKMQEGRSAREESVLDSYLYIPFILDVCAVIYYLHYIE